MCYVHTINTTRRFFSLDNQVMHVKRSFEILLFIRLHCREKKKKRKKEESKKNKRKKKKRKRKKKNKRKEKKTGDGERCK